MEIVKGQIVISRQGRDVTRPYMVVAVKEGRVYLADGQKRTLQSPKAKNLRHVNPTRQIIPPEEAGSDLQVRTALAAFSLSCKTNTLGG